MGNTNTVKYRVKIRYDRKTMRLVRVIFIISITISAICIVPQFFKGIFSDLFLEFIQYFICFWLGIVEVLSGIILLDCICYFRMLKKCGYEIPEDRARYGNDIRRLPRDEECIDYIVRPKRCVVLSVLSLIGFGCSVFYDVKLLLEWNLVGIDWIFGPVTGIVVDVTWLVLGVSILRQLNKKKYKEDYELDNSRRDRFTLIYSLILIAIVTWITIVTRFAQDTYMSYVYHGRMEHDRQQLEDIGNSMWNIYQNRTMDPTLEDSNERIYKVLEQGIMITDCDIPQNAYMRDVAGCLEIESFKELTDKLYLAEGEAQVHVVLRDGEITVTLLNPVERAKKTGIYYTIDTSSEYSMSFR